MELKLLKYEKCGGEVDGYVEYDRNEPFFYYLCSSHDMHGVCIDYFLRGVEAYSLIVCLRPPFYHFL